MNHDATHTEIKETDHDALVERDTMANCREITLNHISTEPDIAYNLISGGQVNLHSNIAYGITPNANHTSPLSDEHNDYDYAEPNTVVTEDFERQYNCPYYTEINDGIDSPTCTENN